ncbi:hypothetical protein [Altererythrobacter sp. ZODW24]|uniref:hypothetical protein n=1 Tax=Altererythrobacter sp. ZODW24 TaxID=2185142 RepID=UPI000DF79326|nr:hypothetical protein [Altererythrobacter sp. ZODW24]
MNHPYLPSKIPPFHPVPVRARSDGWTPLKQSEFIGMLAETRSVAAAARFVGMARETAYRLRVKPGAESFAAAWDAALGFAPRMSPHQSSNVTRGSRKVTGGGDWDGAAGGRFQPVMRRGRYAGSVYKAQNSELLAYLTQIDRSFAAERKALLRKLRSRTQSGGYASLGGEREHG